MPSRNGAAGGKNSDSEYPAATKYRKSRLEEILGQSSSKPAL
jgi:hypothetical protein